MRIHHLNCISSCPLGGRLMDNFSPYMFQRGHLTCHCLLIEAGDRLVLVDTGIGLRDVADPKGRLGALFLFLLRPEFREQMTARHQIAALGLDPDDVTDIVLTQLDCDHAGGLDDFPRARVHMMAREREHAAKQRTWLDRQRFRPQQWSTSHHWYTYRENAGDRWMGFARVRDLYGMPPEILLVPLPGHTLGHAGVAVRHEAGWRLLAGDAYFHWQEMKLKPRCTPGLRFYQWMMEQDRGARLANQRRLRELRAKRGREVEVFCSHDVREFERLSGRAPELPAHAFARRIRLVRGEGGLATRGFARALLPHSHRERSP